MGKGSRLSGLGWASGQLTSVLVPGSDCVLLALQGPASFLNLFPHTWEKENCRSLDSDLP